MKHSLCGHPLRSLSRALLGLALLSHASPGSARAQAGADSLGQPAPSSGSTYENAVLDPPTAPPWNPPGAVSGHETWEQVLRFPGRFVSFPLSLVGGTSEYSLLFIEDQSVIPRTIALFAIAPRLGLVVGAPDLGARTGFGLRVGMFPPYMRRWLLFDVSATTAHYHQGRVSVGKGSASLDYRYDWRPNELFFGLGPDASADDESAYALQTEQWRAELKWPPRESRIARLPFEIAGWGGHRDAVLRAGRDPKEPTFDAVFPALAATRLDRGIAHLVYGGRLMLDRRHGTPHWGAGYRLAGSVERFDKPVEALALRRPEPAGTQFTQYTIEAATAFSFMRDPRTVRFEVRAVGTEITSGAERMLFYDLPRLGGSAGLSGFETGRFHDLDMVLGKVSYIYPLQQHFEFDIHVEAGGVYQDMQNDLTWNSLSTSYGVALRARTAFSPLGYLGLDWSREAVRLRFSFGGVE